MVQNLATGHFQIHSKLRELMRKRVIFVCLLIHLTLLTTGWSLALAEEIQSPQTAGAVVEIGRIVKAISWGNVAQWFTTIVALTLAGFSLYRQNQDKKLMFDIALSELAEDIATFWTLLRDAYGQYCSARADLPNQLSEFIRQVGPLPTPVLDDARNWRQRNAGALGTLSSGMLEFVSAVYPKGLGIRDNIPVNGLINDNRFHPARGRLAHFWQNRGESVSLRYLKHHHQNEDELLAVLTWLEIALHECLDTKSPKARLFEKASALWKTRG